MANKKAKGKKSKSRGILKKKKRQKLTVNGILKKFNEGEKVIIKINPSIHAATPHRRFQGNAGKIIKSRGNCYEVQTKKGKKDVTLIIHPMHMFRTGDKK